VVDREVVRFMVTGSRLMDDAPPRKHDDRTSRSWPKTRDALDQKTNGDAAVVAAKPPEGSWGVPFDAAPDVEVEASSSDDADLGPRTS